MPQSPTSPILSAYTTSTNLSPPFTYSTTRPPTSFSETSTRNRNRNRSNTNTSSSRSRSRSGSRSYSSHNGRNRYTKSPYAPPETPLPPIPRTNPFEDDTGIERDSDLYHTSDWLSTAGLGDDETTSPSPKSTKLSRTSYKPSSRPLNSLPPDAPLESSVSPYQYQYTAKTPGTSYPYTAKTPATSYPFTGRTTPRVQFADQQSLVIDSPSEITLAGRKTGEGRSVPSTAAPDTADMQVDVHGGPEHVHEERTNQNRQSTLPSVLSLSHLAAYNPNPKRGDPSPRANRELGISRQPSPATSPSTNLLNPICGIDDNPDKVRGETQQEIHHRIPYSKSTTPDMHKQQTRLIDPKDQNRLGRMSVAPARYTLPPRRKSGVMTGITNTSQTDPTNTDTKSRRRTPDLSAGTNLLARLRHSALIRSYQTYRPFISPLLSLICALVLTVTHGINPDSPIGNILLVEKEVFDISRAGGTDVALGVWGWCQAKTNGVEPQCQGYSFRDFASDDLGLTIPGDSSLDNLSSLLTALTALTWLLATYQTISAFLHFYLFFALSVPFNHLVEITLPPIPSGPSGANKGPANSTEKARPPLSRSTSSSSSSNGTGQDPVIAEVDLRVRCERFPYESYLWVWWAWWGHRRSPLEHVFGNLVGVLGIATFSMTYRFRSDILAATGSEFSKVEFDHGAYMSPMTVLFTLDTFVLSFKYFWNFKRNLHTLLNPPSPSPRVLLLPASENTILQHHRRTGIQSFFAPISSTPGNTGKTRSRMVDTYLNPLTGRIKTNLTPNEDGGTLDEETLRWLNAYPLDAELTPLISDLRQGKYHPHFLLSDIGLLYLRPPPDENSETESALLVPPSGVIRLELLQDAHLDRYPPDEGVTPGGGLEGKGEGEAHNGLEIMITSLNENFWWNGMEIDCKEFIENCQVCFERLREVHGRVNKTFQVG
ncbi:hypothetical protein I302_103688 [Kwoniella bestiolae CBS 10118]|uniref:Integrase zinc-binding domain-containing protein n=1 Tax=Kwoniella bestiolae CBS 10118 TaxID=1296100 RepID=A0A1B9G985_9TREE|nr:hypothetical protein I302_02393 [Kwoniella bestiolae CBS 10118]OCF27551.1 hypothetical protein I302_02393 [Kwoniella bestiolae CBS 10118]